MNPLLARLHPYPFERWRELTADIQPPSDLRPISLGIGEPRHATPALIEEALVQALPGLSVYPPTLGELTLREAMAAWVQQRYGCTLNPATQVLPVGGTREALFAIAQTVIDPTRPGGALVVCPNPFYQIYEGAALLAGADTAFVPSVPGPGGNFVADWGAVDDATWARTQLLYVCSPGNPTGTVLTLAEWQKLFELSDRHGFVIASDECYSEIWFGNEPPLGALTAAQQLGREDLRKLLLFTSLSKRSNVPGLRSGFVAGDARLIKPFLLYRTYHGSALSLVVQRASLAAWRDETHVQANRALYRAKFDAVLPILQPVLDLQRPDAAFYLWAGVPGGQDGTPGDEIAFARTLLAQYNVATLPGRLLARAVRGVTPGANPETNPGAGRLRLALVAPLEDCVEAARRIAACATNHSPPPR